MAVGFDRLSAAGLTNLAVEAPDAPMHVGALAVLEGRSLPDGHGHLRLAELRRWIDHRLGSVPRLRQVVHRPGSLASRPLWTDDGSLAIERHVRQVQVEPPGGKDQLLRLTERRMGPPLDRSRPLWMLWFVTGLPAGGVAVIIKVHHAVADGLATVRIVGSLLDTPETIAPAENVHWVPAARPSRRALIQENLATKTAAVAAVPDALRRWRQPGQLRPRAQSAWTGARSLARSLGAPRTSLTGPVGPRRRLAVIRLELADAKNVAHTYGGKVNDVVLDLIAAGSRELLSSRGERVLGLVLHAAVAVSFRTSAQDNRGGNRSGIVVVRLPLDEPQGGTRLRAISAESARAKREQLAPNEQRFMVWLARSGLLRRYTRRQRLTNLMESNVTGPAAPIHVLGAPVLDLLPVGVLAGNLALSFLAFSYTGRLSITVCADADHFPDLPVLEAAMNARWTAILNRSRRAAGELAIR